MRFIRFKALKDLLGGISRSTIDRWEAEKNFPKRVSLGKNTVGWLLDDVQKWIKDKSKENS